METDIQAWYAGVPVITKWFLTLSFGTTLAANFGLLDPYHLIFNFDLVVYKFQIWRLFTCILYFGKLGFPFIINMIFLYRYSLMMETGFFDGRKADYLFMLLFNVAVLLLIAIPLDLMIVGLSLVLSILYVWSQLNREAIVNFWFGLKFKAMYFPWVLAAFTVLLGGSPMLELVGIAVGHLYYFLEFVFPQQYGYSVLRTPSFLYSIFPSGNAGIHGFGAAPMARGRAAGGGNVDRNATNNGGHQWGGGGRRLGDH